MSLVVDLPVTFQEAMGQEKPTLAEVFGEVLSCLRERHDAVVFGAYAVNAYVESPRMTADIDVMTTNEDGLLALLCERLHDRFRIAVRVRAVAKGRGFRVYQLRRDGKNRHLVDVRAVDALPASQEIDGVLVVRPAELVVLKLQSYVARRNTDKGLSDKLDLHRLLLAYPEYRLSSGPVASKLVDASPELTSAWTELLAERIARADDDEY